MTDNAAQAPAAGGETSQWGGLEAFIKSVFGGDGSSGSNSGMPTAAGAAQGLLKGAPGAGAHPKQIPIPPAFQANGTVTGPINAKGVVTGPAGAAGIMPQQSYATPMAPPPSGVMAPPAALTGNTAGVAMPQAPPASMSSPALFGNTLTANHFETGMPNPTGAR